MDFTISTKENWKESDITDLGDIEVSIEADGNFPNTPSSSLASQDPMDIIQSVRTSEHGDQNIFSKFLEIKHKNEALKSNVYSQFWKQTSKSHHRLSIYLDSEI